MIDSARTRAVLLSNRYLLRTNTHNHRTNMTIISVASLVDEVDHCTKQLLDVEIVANL
jgi:hypothetical protein